MTQWGDYPPYIKIVGWHDVKSFFTNNELTPFYHYFGQYDNKGCRFKDQKILPTKNKGDLRNGKNS